MKNWIKYSATALAVAMCVMIGATTVRATVMSGDTTIQEGKEFNVATALTITDCISNYGTVTISNGAIYLHGSFYNAGTIQREGNNSHTNDMEVEGTLYNAGTISEDVTIQLHYGGKIYLDYESTYTASNIVVNDYVEATIYYEVLDGTDGAFSELDGTVNGNFTGINDSKYYAEADERITITPTDVDAISDITVVGYISGNEIEVMISQHEGVIYFTMPDEPVIISVKSQDDEGEGEPAESETPSTKDTTTGDTTTGDTTASGSTSSGTTATVSSTSTSTATTVTDGTADSESATTSISPKTADESPVVYMWLLAAASLLAAAACMSIRISR